MLSWPSLRCYVPSLPSLKPTLSPSHLHHPSPHALHMPSPLLREFRHPHFTDHRLHARPHLVPLPYPHAFSRGFSSPHFSGDHNIDIQDPDNFTTSHVGNQEYDTRSEYDTYPQQAQSIADPLAPAGASYDLETVAYDPNSVNKAVLTGKVGWIGNLKKFSDTKCVFIFTLGVGGNKTTTDWYKVEVWNELAWSVDSNIEKKDRLMVQGRLALEQYTDREGKEVQKPKVIASRVVRVEGGAAGLGDQGWGQESEDRGTGFDEYEPQQQQQQHSQWNTRTTAMDLDVPAEPVGARGQYQLPSGGRAGAGAWGGSGSRGWERTGASQERTGGSGSSSSSSKKEKNEQLWRELVDNPGNFWDNREKKTNPRAPDFVHKTTKDALWLDNAYTPDYIKVQFEKE